MIYEHGNPSSAASFKWCLRKEGLECLQQLFSFDALSSFLPSSMHSFIHSLTQLSYRSSITSVPPHHQSPTLTHHTPHIIISSLSSLLYTTQKLSLNLIINNGRKRKRWPRKGRQGYIPFIQGWSSIPCWPYRTLPQEGTLCCSCR